MAKAVYDAQHAAAASVSRLPMPEPLIEMPTPAAMTTTTPRNDSAAPANFCGVSVSTPMIPARTATRTGVEAMISALSPAGMNVRPVVHRIWYSPKPRPPRTRIRTTSGRGNRTPPSDQRRIASNAIDASP